MVLSDMVRRSLFPALDVSQRSPSGFPPDPGSHMRTRPETIQREAVAVVLLMLAVATDHGGWASGPGFIGGPTWT
jgi:hypothetical protein